MPATDPHDLQKQFYAHFTEGDVDGLIALYEPDALFVGPGREEAVGTEAVRAALESLLSLSELSFTYTPGFQARSGDVALMHASWSLTGTDPRRGPVALSGVTVEVARRGADGGWRYVVDCPFGSASVGMGAAA